MRVSQHFRAFFDKLRSEHKPRGFFSKKIKFHKKYVFALMHILRDGIIIFSLPECAILYASGAVKSLFGFTEKELVGKNLRTLHTSEDFFSMHKNRLFAAQQEGRDYLDLEIELLRKDGSRVWVSMRSAFFSRRKSNPVAFCMLRDVSQYKLMEMTLRESEKRSRALLEASTESMFLLNLDKRILACNAVAAKRLGWGHDELLGESIIDLFKEDKEEFIDLFDDTLIRVIESGEAKNIKYQRYGRRMHAFATPILDPYGKVKEIALFAHDITEEYKRQQEAAQTHQRESVINHILLFSHA
jgi:PAS domain S-box-containing protein